MEEVKNLDNNNITMTDADVNNNTPPKTTQPITGKRARKKNPRYSDNFSEQIPVKATKNGRPKKKRKLTNTNNTQINNLYEKKKNLENQIFEIKKELDDIKLQLNEKKAEIVQDEHFNAPTDDEDEMDISVPKPIVPFTNNNTGTRGRRKKRGSVRKATTPKKRRATYSPPIPPPKNNRPSNKSRADPVLLPVFSLCRDILDSLMKHRYGFPFNVPVDPVALQIPDYFTVITHPMDFSTVRKKLNLKQYANHNDFIDDVNLVFNNACLYNLPTSDVYLMAESLRKLFKKKTVAIEKKISQKSSTNKPVPQNIRKPIDAITSIKPKESTISVESVSNSTNEVELTKEEKKRLSMRINSLTGHQLATVVKIIQTNLPHLPSSDREITVEVDALDTNTLRCLQEFIESTKKNNKRKPKKKSSDSKIKEKLNSSVSDSKNTSVNENSESDSEDSESGSESDSVEIGIFNIDQVPVETVMAPILNDSAIVQDAPKIISTNSINTSEVNVDKLDLWSDLANQKEESTTITHSPDVANLWSTFRDNHAQVQQKELEKKLHEERIKKAKEEEEEERKRKEEEYKRKILEEKELKKKLEEEEKLKAEREIEEARQKAKRDREKKVQDEDSKDSHDLLSLNSIDTTGSIALNMSFPGGFMSDIRSSLKLSNVEQSTEDTTK